MYNVHSRVNIYALTTVPDTLCDRKGVSCVKGYLEEHIKSMKIIFFSNHTLMSSGFRNTVKCVKFPSNELLSDLFFMSDSK